MASLRLGSIYDDDLMTISGEFASHLVGLMFRHSVELPAVFDAVDACTLTETFGEAGSHRGLLRVSRTCLEVRLTRRRSSPYLKPHDCAEVAATQRCLEWRY